MMRHGRKFAVTVGGIVAVVALAAWAIAHAQPDPSASVGAIGLMVGAFCGSNAWNHATAPKTPAGDA
jgi:hypothetical protein